MLLSPQERDFIRDGRDGGGFIDVSGFLADHDQNPDGLADIIDNARTVAQGQRNLAQASSRLRHRRSVLFFCGDCDQFHDLAGFHLRKIDGQPHVHADNGGAILLDPKITVVRGFRQSQYWTHRLVASIDIKFSELGPGEIPEIYLYTHFVCAQGRLLGMFAPEQTLSACHGKTLLKRISQRRRNGRGCGSAFKVGLLTQVDYGDYQRTYWVMRRQIRPIAVWYHQRHEQQLDLSRWLATPNS